MHTLERLVGGGVVMSRRSIEVFEETGPPEPQTIALFPEDR